VSYWFGKNPFSSTSIRPYVLLGGGLAQYDSKVKVQVYENPDPNDPSRVDGPFEAIAWKKAGTSFIQGGVGALVPFDFKSGIIAEIKLMQAFSATGFGANLALGYQMGL
jgi:hypothetical protein